MWYRSLLIRRTICLDIAHACESWHSRRSCCSAIFKQTVVNQPTFPTEGRKTHTRNPIESAREFSLLWPEYPQSILARALWEFSCEASQKKLFLERARVQPQEGPPGLHAPCWYSKQSQLPPINKWYRSCVIMSFVRWPRVRTPVSTSLYRFKLPSLCFIELDVKAWHTIQSWFWYLEMKIKIEMVQIDEFERHKIGETKFLKSVAHFHRF